MFYQASWIKDGRRVYTKPEVVRDDAVRQIPAFASHLDPLIYEAERVDQLPAPDGKGVAPRSSLTRDEREVLRAAHHQRCPIGPSDCDLCE